MPSPRRRMSRPIPMVVLQALEKMAIMDKALRRKIVFTKKLIGLVLPVRKWKSGLKHVTCDSGIGFDLNFECVDAVEFFFRPDEFAEYDVDAAAIEVFREIEDMHFELPAPACDCRADAEVGDARAVDRLTGEAEMDGPHAVRWQAGSGGIDVRGGEADGSAELAAFDHGAAHSVRSA